MHRPATKKRTVSPIYLDDDGVNQASDKVVLRTWTHPVSPLTKGADILPMLPPTHQFIDVYGTSPGVMFQRSPAKVETFNDIHGDVHNFFRVLREDEAGLRRAIGEGEAPDGPIARALAFYRQTEAWGCDSVESLAERFMRIQIENRPPLDILRVYDTPDALFFLEIPYLPDGAGMSFSMTEENVDDLAEAVSHIQGKVLISAKYERELSAALPDGQVIESGLWVWSNYAREKAVRDNHEPSLFD